MPTKSTTHSPPPLTVTDSSAPKVALRPGCTGALPCPFIGGGAMAQTPPAIEQAEEEGATDGSVGPDTGTMRTAEPTLRRLASATRATTDRARDIAAMPDCYLLSEGRRPII